MTTRPLAALDRHPWSWLTLWTLLIAATQLRWGLGVLAWIAPLPALRYLRTTTGWRSRGLLVAAGCMGWLLAVLKITTAPIPATLAPVFALPIAFFTIVPLLAYDRFRQTGRESAGLFAALMVLGEWAQHGLTPFASWGAAAYTQLDNLPLLQLASVTGMAGVSGLVHLVGATAEATLAGTRSPRALALAGGAVVGVMALGSVRLAVLETDDTVPVAAINTDADVSGRPLPDAATVARWNTALAARTRRAAAAGAELAVWTEAATLALPEDEAQFLEDTAALARDAQLELVAGYVVPLAGEPLVYHNRYAWFSATGELLHTYDKHNPVPGEPAIAGEGPLPLVETAGQRRSGAICYDYDVPRFSLQHARLGADLVALPSSDWRGIDPIHTQMAGMRAIEGGHSVLRSTRWGLSAGIDPAGRLRGWQSAFEDGGDGVLLVRLPRHGHTTLYGMLGDWFIVLCAVLALALPLLGRRREGPPTGTTAAPTAA